MKNHLFPPILLGLAVMQGGAPGLTASSFGVNPVRIELSAKQPHSMVQVSNPDTETVTVQVQLVTWLPGSGEDVYRDSEDILVNPPIFILKGRQTQIIRLGMRKMRPGALESSYRLILHEVPTPPKAEAEGVRTLLRVSLPIFVRPSSPVAPLLAWEVQRISEKRLKLSVRNTGTGHIQFRQMWLTAGGHEEPGLVKDIVSYVLPGGRREWLIDYERTAGAQRVSLRAQTDLGILHESLAIQSP